MVFQFAASRVFSHIRCTWAKRYLTIIGNPRPNVAQSLLLTRAPPIHRGTRLTRLPVQTHRLGVPLLSQRFKCIADIMNNTSIAMHLEKKKALTRGVETVTQPCGRRMDIMSVLRYPLYSDNAWDAVPDLRSDRCAVRQIRSQTRRPAPRIRAK